MRGKIDLSGHKLANVYRAPAPRERWKRYKPPKLHDDIYAQLVRLVDGAVRDALANHPEYLTKVGQRNARPSIIKRVTGTLWGYGKEASFAAQAARGRSVDVVDAPQAMAAETDDGVKAVSSTDGLITWPIPVTPVSGVALGGGAAFNATADKAVLVIRNHFGRVGVAIDYSGEAVGIPLTADQATWPLSALKQAYEFGLLG